MVEKGKRKKRGNKKRGTIDRLLSVITKACKSSGWSWDIESLDETGFFSATIAVRKSVSHNEITALLHINILLDNTVEYSIQKTSFHNYGIGALWSVINNHLKRTGWISETERKDIQKDKPLDLLTKLFKKFHFSAVQLSKRYNDRVTLPIQDEYDVQDYLHALLKILFDDIRPEEFSPSYAGSSSKIDFL